MNNNWFICKIKYEKLMENGVNKKVAENYLVDALSFTEAEKRIIEEMTPVITGEFSVAGVALAKYNDVFFSGDSSDDRWFKCKLGLITLNEKSGVEKKIFINILVEAENISKAIMNLDAGMSNTANYVVASISETNIWDVYPFKVK